MKSKGLEIHMIESDSQEKQEAVGKRKINSDDINLEGEGSKRVHLVGEPSVVNEEKPNIVDSCFVSQCRPKALVELASTMTEKQKEDVRTIGFGFILDLKLKKLSNPSMLRWLVNNFNSVSRIMYIDQNRFFPITADDIFDVLMLPRNKEKPVLRYTRKEDGSILCNHLIEKYQIKSGVPLTYLFDLLKSHFQDGGDDFKRLIILYTLGSFLTPSSNRMITMGVVKSLEDVPSIPKLDWCSYVLDQLCESLTLFKNQSVKSIGGCILLLQIIYFHRLEWRGVAVPCTLPLINVWNDKKISERCAEEAKAGLYGSGILCCEKFPLTVNGKLKSNKKPEAVQEESEVSKDFDDIEDVKELFSNLKKDANELLSKYMSKIVKINERNRERKERMRSSSCSFEDSGSQGFFMDENLHKYVDDLCQNFTAIQELADNMPSFELLTPEPAVVRDERYFGLDDNVQGNDDNEVEEAEEHQTVENEELNSAMKTVCSEDKTTGPDLSSRFWNICEDVGYVSKYMTTHKKLLCRMEQMHKEVLDYCSYEAEKGSSVERYYRRGFYLFVESTDILSMLGNNEISMPIINAWCNELNNDMFVDGRRPRFVFNLEHSNALRQIIERKSDTKELLSEIKTAWNNWLDTTKDTLCSVDMIFLPYCLDGHYAAACVDFVNCKVFSLDSRKYADQDQRIKFELAAELMGNVCSHYIRKKQHPKALDLLSYDCVNVNFKWQTTRIDKDCGVYLMHHMKYFNGEVYTTPDLNKADIRKVLRAKICASLILSNNNEVRTQVIQKVYTFYKDKPSLLKLLAEKKKEKAMKKQEERRMEAAEKLKKMSEIKRGKSRLE